MAIRTTARYETLGLLQVNRIVPINLKAEFVLLNTNEAHDSSWGRMNG